MKKFLITGSSASAGYGLTNEEMMQCFWPTDLIQSQFPLCNMVNASIVGGGNAEIFNETYANIKTGNFTHAMVTWSVIPRTNINYGFELYPTSSTFVVFSEYFIDINLVSNQTITAKEQRKQKFNTRYYNYHWDILDLVIKCNLLIDLAKQYSCQIGFVNFCLPWKHEQFFNKIEWTTPTELDGFTQEILSSEDRDDAETKLLYEVMHSAYEKFGGIREDYWLNLYDPFYDYQVDYIGSKTGGHPGPGSQTVIAQLLQSKFNQLFV